MKRTEVSTLKQTTLSKFRIRELQTPSVSSGESDRSSPPNKKRAICQWSRVKARHQLSVKNVRVYNIDEELGTLEAKENPFSGRFYCEDPFLFHPKQYDGKQDELCPAKLEMPVGALRDLARQASGIRSVLAAKALAECNGGNAPVRDLADLEQEIPKSLKRTYTPKKAKGATRDETCGFDEAESPH